MDQQELWSRALDQHYEDEWTEETGLWGSEECDYVGNAVSFVEWREERYPGVELPWATI